MECTDSLEKQAKQAGQKHSGQCRQSIQKLKPQYHGRNANGQQGQRLYRGRTEPVLSVQLQALCLVGLQLIQELLLLPSLHSKTADYAGFAKTFRNPVQATMNLFGEQQSGISVVNSFPVQQDAAQKNWNHRLQGYAPIDGKTDQNQNGEFQDARADCLTPTNGLLFKFVRRVLENSLRCLCLLACQIGGLKAYRLSVNMLTETNNRVANLLSAQSLRQCDQQPSHEPAYDRQRQHGGERRSDRRRFSELSSECRQTRNRKRDGNLLNQSFKCFGRN